ncbi:hypothetical protein RM553_03120 [Zunongwangia sp. F363]|uniref:Uncharacterized protein n=1 Tax=Autumnicola tepida TaxID=3075595 RepID=A0ABU3C6X7_9FLAO|nr:protealysin inhibitor emfourin [Zunongwangia sp. F363]MDT0641815.1 hypothetical protein [Zunongwangia sp. F363]
MKIHCAKSGGFMGRLQSCTLELDELNPSENEAFKEVVKKKDLRDENARDSFVYCFSFEENNIPKEINIEESLIQENMQAFIDKVNSKLT